MRRAILISGRKPGQGPSGPRAETAEERLDRFDAEIQELQEAHNEAADYLAETREGVNQEAQNVNRLHEALASLEQKVDGIVRDLMTHNPLSGLRRALRAAWSTWRDPPA